MARRNAASRDDDPSNAPTRQGTVKRIVTDKGFGFIADGAGKEYFFHRSAAPDFDSLTQGDAVTFVPGSGPKGPRAESVQAS